MLDMKVFTSNFAGLWELYAVLRNKPDEQPTKALMRIYYNAVKYLSNEQFEMGVAEVIRTRKYSTLPSPAEIIEASQGDKDMQAHAAFDKLVYAIKTHGRLATVVFDDPVIHRMVEGYPGGWLKLCAIEYDELKWFKKDFLRDYPKMVGNVPEKVEPLVGQLELDNAQRFPEYIPDPQLIGDRARATELLGEQAKIGNEGDE